VHREIPLRQSQVQKAAAAGSSTSQGQHASAMERQLKPALNGNSAKPARTWAGPHIPLDTHLSEGLPQRDPAERTHNHSRWKTAAGKEVRS